MSGSVEILNIAEGEMKLSFDKADPAESLRAARIVSDMLSRGYALLIEVERDGVKKWERALAFHKDTQEYLIADFDPVVQSAGPPDRGERNDEPDSAQPAAESAAPQESGATGRGRGRPRKAVAADSVDLVAVGRSAGG
jgi:hypothetical protein